MPVRTKIVATVGPASRETALLRQLVQAGCDVFRINFSHGSHDDHEQALRNIRQVEQELGRPVAVMADLCGPKIRVGRIAGGQVRLSDGGWIVLQRQPVEGTAERISTTLPELIDAVRPGQTIMLDDGKLRLAVSAIRPPESVTCLVVRGGVLSSAKGVNLPDTQLDIPALTEKDRADAAWLARRPFDYVALSFVRTAQDIRALRALLGRHRCQAHIVAKFEKPQALEHAREIIAAADAAMVARGDLGVEMDLPAVPIAQKRLARLCQQLGKPCIVATQMLESMISSPAPTRAEVSDVANAALDHADAVMLSGETAVGQFPVEAVTMMNRVLQAVEAWHDDLHDAVAQTPPEHAPEPTVSALASAVKAILRAEKIAAVAVFTLTGQTARVFSKSRLNCPILALSPDLSVVRRMALYYGVAAVRQAQPPEHTRDVLALAEQIALSQGIAAPGDKLVVVSGRPIGAPDSANTLVVHTVKRA